MAISDDRRIALHHRLDEVLGPNEAETLMEQLQPWAELATKADFEGLHHDFEGLHHGFETLRHDFEGLRHDFDVLRRGLDSRIDRLDSRIDRLDEKIDFRIETLEYKIRGEFNDRLAAHTRALALAITGNTAVVAMLAFAAANL